MSTLVGAHQRALCTLPNFALLIATFVNHSSIITVDKARVTRHRRFPGIHSLGQRCKEFGNTT